MFEIICYSSQWTSEVAQSCPTRFDPMDCSLPGSSIHGIFQARVLEYFFLLQGIFLTLGLDPGLPHCRQTLYCLSHQGSPVKWLGFWQTFLYWPQEELFTHPPCNAWCYLLVNMVPNFWTFSNLVRIRCKVFSLSFFLQCSFNLHFSTT